MQLQLSRGPQPVHGQLKKELMKQHSQRYAALPAKRQEEYDMEAQKLRDQMAQDTSQELLHLKHALALHRSRAAQVDDALDLPCLLSNCRFSVQQRTQLHNDWKKLATGMKTRCIEDTLQRIRSPRAIGMQFAEHLSMFDVPAGFFQVYPSKTPPWAKLVCRHRDVMKGTVLQFTFDTELQHVLICYVMRSPHLVVVCPLRLLPQELPVVHASVAELLDVLDGIWTFAWHLPDELTYVTDKDLPHLDVQNVAVIPDVMWNNEGQLLSVNDAIPLTEYLIHLPKIAKDKKDDEEVAAGELLDAQVLDELPWLRDYAFIASHTRIMQASSSSRANQLSARPLHEPDQEEIDASYEALLARRRLLELEPAHRTDGFATKILGGQWTLQFKHKAYDAIAGTTCTEHAKRFCAALGFNSMASFAVAKYSEEVANRLALEWVSVMFFFTRPGRRRMRT